MNTHSSTDNRGIIKRELKIEDHSPDNREFKEIEEYLNTVSKKFMGDPLSIENLDRVYSDMAASKKNEKNESGSYQ